MGDYTRGLIIGVYMGALALWMLQKMNDRLKRIEQRPLTVAPRPSEEVEASMKEARRKYLHEWAEELRSEGLVIAEAS